MPWWGWALRVTGIGWYIAASIVGGILAGVYLDRWLGTKPLFLLLGLLLGTVVAFYGVYRIVQPLLTQPPRQGPKSSDKPR